MGKRMLKPILAGGVALALLATGGSWLIASVWGKAYPVIEERTEVLVERWCLVCGEYQPADADPAWQGLSETELADRLSQDWPGAKILSFSREQVTVLLPPGYCDKCMALLPPQGYISLAENNLLAVFALDGTLFKVYGEAPGAWLEELREGIPFSSPQDCLDWLVNLTS